MKNVFKQLGGRGGGGERKQNHVQRDLSDFDSVAFEFSETAGLLGFSHTTVTRVCTV